jgi:DNA-directed RNA polymerase subunit H (RpoH/RPB5)
VLVDSESLTIVSPLSEPWFPMKVKKREVFLDVESHRVIPKQYSGASIIVEAEPLDSILQKFNIRKLHLIKIDAEDAELEVLHGLKKALRTHPTLIIESRHPYGVKEFLRQFGYASYLLAENNFLFFPKKGSTHPLT